MKLVYQYIKFNKITDEQYAYSCTNKKSGDVLGHVGYYLDWKQWIFTQSDEGIVFSASCLRDIAEFLDALKGA